MTSLGMTGDVRIPKIPNHFNSIRSNSGLGYLAQCVEIVEELTSRDAVDDVQSFDSSLEIVLSNCSMGKERECVTRGCEIYGARVLIWVPTHAHGIHVRLLDIQMGIRVVRL